MTEEGPLIVGLGGTTRAASTSERALAIALAHARRLGARTQMFAGTDMALDLFDPADATRSRAASSLIEALRCADGVIIATPSYHGSISGMIKNALDYTEDNRGAERPYLEGRAVGCIVCAEGPQAMGSTLLALRSIVHALRGWPTPYAAVVNTTQSPFGTDGKTPDRELVKQLNVVAEQVVDFAKMHRLYDEWRSDGVSLDLTARRQR